MYGMLSSLELICLLFAVIFGWIAGIKAARLLYARSAERMRRKARKLLFWAVFATVPAAGALVAIALMVGSLHPLFWRERLLLHAPLVALPVVTLWLLSVPKLRALRSMTRDAAPEQPPQQAARSLAADPGLVVPFQLTAFGSLAAFYFAMVPPVPARWPAVVLPLAIALLAATALWLKHARRRLIAGRAEAYAVPRLWRRMAPTAAVLCAAALIGALFFSAAQANSRLPERLDMTAGPADYGDGPPLAHDHGGHAGHADGAAKSVVSIASLTGPKTAEPDRRITLTAEQATVTLSSGKKVDAWTFNGQIPGPELRFTEGETVEVTLVNKNIAQGVTIHWHGLDVPNAEDGVAGVTQDAVLPGETHTYRLRAEQVGTFWYHSHQDSKEAVDKGLFGPLIVEPKNKPAAAAQTQDITVMSHEWKKAGMAVGADDQVRRMAIAPGTPVRMRLINTDDWIRQTYQLTGASFQVAAIDGTDLHEPGTLTNARLDITTGGRYDITFTMPDRTVFLAVGREGKLGVFMSPDGKGDIPDLPQAASFDPLHYGSPAPTPFDANSKFDRSFTMVLDNRLGFFNGSFNQLYTLNGEVFPNTPMFMVKEGELVKTTIVNRGMVDHPMHLHGHHILVLSRNGEPASGSPWWSDTLDVQPGDTYEVAFRADNPGIWMDHCHNLTHAAAGMTMHLMYDGVTTPYSVGSASRNHPE